MLFGKLSQWEIHHYLESIRDMRYCCFLGEGAVSKFRNMESMTITHASPNVHKLSWVGRHMPLTCPSKYSTGTWQCNTAAIPNSEYHFLVKHGHNKTKKYECFWCFLWHKSSNFRSRVSPIGTANVHSLYYTFLSTQSTRKTHSDFWSAVSDCRLGQIWSYPHRLHRMVPQNCDVNVGL